MSYYLIDVFCALFYSPTFKTMKLSIFLSFLGTMILLSCVDKAPKELSNEQKQTIIENVNAQWEISGQGIEEKDAFKAFSVFHKDARYIREGYLYQHIDTAMNQYARGFSRSSGTGSTITSDPLYFDVLNENTVVMTSIAFFFIANIGINTGGNCISF